MTRNLWPNRIMLFILSFLISSKSSMLMSLFIVYSIFSFNLFFFTHFFSLLVPYANVSIESIECILLSPFELKVILLISSVKTLCFKLLNLCLVSNINFFYQFFMFSFVTKETVSVNFIFF